MRRIFNASFVNVAIFHIIVAVTHCESAENIVTIDICREQASNESKPYCQCEEQVISCDFSSFESNETHEFILNGWNDNANSNIRRLCVCGGPHNLVLVVSPNIFLGLRQLHRVDFFDIPGIIHLRNAFSSYFSGDFYASKVRINTFHPMQFGAADPFTIEDVSDLKCCSKISVPQKFNRPTFYMEDSKIGKVSANGIHNSHLWKTFVWKNVSTNVDDYGINLKNPGMNVSFMGCTFNHTNETAIVFKNTANILLAKNTFTNYSHFYPMVLKSTQPDSTVLMIENTFKNKIVMDVDATKVLGLFNIFDWWDNYTFIHMNHSKHNDRFYLMSLNSVQNAIKFNKYSIPNALPKEFRHFYENVLGHCTCEGAKVTFPSILKNTKCEYHDSANNICNPDIESVLKKCSNPGNVFKVSCSSEERALVQIPMDYLQMIKDLLHLHKKNLNSPFIVNMLQSSRDHYEVLPLEGEKPVFEPRTSFSPSRTKGIYPLIIFFCVQYFLYRYTH